MLKQRVITAAILTPVVLLFIFFAPYWLFATGMAALLVAAGWEFCGLIHVDGHRNKSLYVLLLLIVATITYFIPISVSFYVALLWWCFATVMVFLFPKGKWFWDKHLWLRILVGIFILVPFIDALLFIKLQQGGSVWMLLILLIVWAADTGAYFSGKKFGKTKLLPNVSPNKTREGIYGGLALAGLIIAIFGFILQNPLFLHFGFLASLLLCVLFSVMGDLTESALKRFADVKDSGGLLPGHGGLLDRIDSLTAALPIFALSLWLFT